MKEHVHVWAFFEMDDKMAAEVGVRFMGVCVGDGEICFEKRYEDALPPGYRKSDLTTPFGTKKDNPSGAYVFDLKELRKQLGADADLEPFLEKKVSPEKPASAPAAASIPDDEEPPDWTDSLTEE